MPESTADGFDNVLAEWAVERPDLDASPILVIGRLFRLGQFIDRFYEESVAPFGLTPGDFFVLCELRRAGEPYTLSPSRLSRTLVRSSGGMTKQLDNLERKGLVRRSRARHDRRGVQVKLTSKGHSLVDEALTAHIDNEQRLLSSVTPAEQRRLATMLRRLLGVLEASPSGRGGSQHDADQAANHPGSSPAGRPGLATRAASG